MTAAKFLHGLKIFRARDLPYQTQLVPLAAILAELGPNWENDAVRKLLVAVVLVRRLRRALRLGGEVTLRARHPDVPPLDHWRTRYRRRSNGRISGRSGCAPCAPGFPPPTRASTPCLMRCGAEDFRSGQPFDQTVFFRRERRYPPYLPRSMVQDRASSRKSTTASSTRRRSQRAPIASSEALPRPPILRGSKRVENRTLRSRPNA